MNLHTPTRTALFLLATGLGGTLAGCASAPTATPVYDAQADALAQASTFVGDNGKSKYLAGVNKVAVTACNVLFAETSAAHAQTGSGIFGEAGNTVRAEAKVSVLYTLDGLDDAVMQQMTTEICANAEQRLTAAGFDVLSRSELMASESFKALLASGKASPFHYKTPGRGSKTTYKAFAADGYTVYDPRYIGTVSGLGQAFKAMSGDSAVQLEARVMDELKVSGVAINVLVDFAKLEGKGQTKAVTLADTNRAEIKHEVDLGISGEIVFKPVDQLGCWDRFGKRECMPNNKGFPTFSSKTPVTTKDQFYTQVVDTTTTGDKVAAVATKALAFLALAGGVSGGTTVDTTRYSVEVEPELFRAVSRKGVDGFMDMAFLTAKSKQ